MPLLCNVDVFVKPRADVRSKSATGGLITILAASTAFLLFVAQTYLYIVGGNASHTLHLSESAKFSMLPHDMADPFQSLAYDIKGKMPLKIHITFLHMDCEAIEIKLNDDPLTAKDYDNSGPNDKYKNRGVKKSKPNVVELRKVFGNEHSAEAMAHKGQGCTLAGLLRVPIVAGQLSVTLTKQAWTRALNYVRWADRATDAHRNDYNMSHYIHTIQFGKKLPDHIVSTNNNNKNSNNKGKGSNIRPMVNRMHVMENHMGGVALESIQVKLVPTLTSESWFFAEQLYYQMSVVAHTVQPETMVQDGLVFLQPGLALTYDVTPLAVHHNNGRDNFLVFLSTLIGIVGGCFVTVGLFTGCLVHSAKVVAKKVD